MIRQLRYSLFGLICILSALQFAHADQLFSIIPKPVSLTANFGYFTLRSDTTIAIADNTKILGQDLAKMIAPATGYALKTASTDSNSNVIRLTIDPSLTKLGTEGYDLIATPDSIAITAPTPAGIFYGLQTLRQLLPPEIFSPTKIARDAWPVPAVQIEDYPRFRWRGLMLDCSRHFFDKAFVERYIDLLAMHKMNSFHWHLTDDQGWRIEIKKYPKLTTVGAFRKETVITALENPENAPPKYDGQPYGGFYTQDDIREVVRYAADRFINVVPEIEFPGHSAAAIAAYPELGNTGKPVEVWTAWGVNRNTLSPEESTIDFYQNVLAEVLELFPSQFIHLGGDEVNTKQWDRSPVAQARIKELGLKNSHDLQPYMLRRLTQFVESHNRRLIGWDEILGDDLPQDAVVMSWRGTKGGIAAAKQGHDVVMAPDPVTYFDHYQSHNKFSEPLTQPDVVTLSAVYAFDPIPKDLPADEAAHVLGAQGQLWTEYVPMPKLAEYQVFPRACALAEDVWTPGNEKNYADFQTRLAEHFHRLEQLKVNYRKPRADDDQPATKP